MNSCFDRRSQKEVVDAFEQFCVRLEREAEPCQEIQTGEEPKPAYLQKHNRNTGAARIKRASKQRRRSK
jgi:hypothetical protein